MKFGPRPTLYKNGYSGEITAEEVKENEDENKQFTMVSPEMELLLKYYEPGTKENHDSFLTTGEIEITLRKQTDDLVKISPNQLGKALRVTGFSRDNRYSRQCSSCTYGWMDRRAGLAP